MISILVSVLAQLTAPDAAQPALRAAPVAEVVVEVDTLTETRALTFPEDPAVAIRVEDGGRFLDVGGQRIALDELLGVRFRRISTPSSGSDGSSFWLVRFRNGDVARARLSAPSADLDEDALGLTLLGASAPRDVPLYAIRALAPAASVAGTPGLASDAAGAESRLWRRLAAVRSEDDTVFVRSDRPDDATNRIVGLVEEFANERLVVNSDRLGDLELPYRKIEAVVLADPDEDIEPSSPPAADAAQAVELHLVSGDTLSGALVSLSPNEIVLEHAHLDRWTSSPKRVSAISFANDRVEYLSDLDPKAKDEFPGPLFQLTRRFEFKRDTNVLHGPLRMNGRPYRKGLGVHSYSLLVYELDEAALRFHATIGLDDSARPKSPDAARANVASVVFRVRVDQKLLFERAMTWRDEPVPISVPVAGGETLSLEVDFGGVPGTMNSVLDRADWADARIVRREEDR